MENKNLMDASCVLVSSLVAGPKDGEAAWDFRCRILNEWDDNRGSDKPENWTRKE